MIIATTLLFNDYEPELLLIDSSKLDLENPLEKMIMEEIQSDSFNKCVNFEVDDDVKGDFRLTSCRHESTPVEIHGQMIVNVIFEC